MPPNSGLARKSWFFDLNSAHTTTMNVFCSLKPLPNNLKADILSKSFQNLFQNNLFKNIFLFWVLITYELLNPLISLISLWFLLCKHWGLVKISIKLCSISKVSLSSWLFLNLVFYNLCSCCSYLFYLLYILRNMFFFV